VGGGLDDGSENGRLVLELALQFSVRRRAREFVELLGPTHPHGRRGDGLEVFMRFAGSSDEDMGGEELTMWPDLEAIEQTLAYDAACMGDYRPPTPASEQVADRDRAEHPPGGAHDPCRPVTRGRPDRGRTSA
jgi:hypothetical protein